MNIGQPCLDGWDNTLDCKYVGVQFEQVPLKNGWLSNVQGKIGELAAMLELSRQMSQKTEKKPEKYL